MVVHVSVDDLDAWNRLKTLAINDSVIVEEDNGEID